MEVATSFPQSRANLTINGNCSDLGVVETVDGL